MFKCPRCGSTYEFNTDSRCYVTYNASEEVVDHGSNLDTGLEDSEALECRDCGYEADAGDFRQEAMENA